MLQNTLLVHTIQMLVQSLYYLGEKNITMDDVNDSLEMAKRIAEKDSEYIIRICFCLASDVEEMTFNKSFQTKETNARKELTAMKDYLAFLEKHNIV